MNLRLGSDILDIDVSFRHINLVVYRLHPHFENKNPNLQVTQPDSNEQLCVTSV